jgi:hypothetical protein
MMPFWTTTKPTDPGMYWADVQGEWIVCEILGDGAAFWGAQMMTHRVLWWTDPIVSPPREKKAEQTP